MHRLLNELKNESSSNKKKEILEKHLKMYPEYVEILHRTLDPFRNSYMKKVPEIEPGQSDFTETFEEFCELFDSLSTRRITGHAALNEVQKFLSTCNKETQDVYTKVLKKDLRCNMGVTLVNKVLSKMNLPLIPEFTVQLAEKYTKDKKYKDKFWYISPKLDGLRSSYIKETLFTRSGKNIIGFPHVIQVCEDLCRLYNLDVIDGELFSKEIPFQTIQSYAMKTKNTNPEETEQIQFNIFAVLGEKITCTSEMVNTLDKICSEYSNPSLTVVKQELIENNFEAIVKKTEEYVLQGYEGSMLRNAETHYVWDRTDDLLKYKFFEEVDLEVVDVFEGTGKNIGKAGGIICRGVVDGFNIVVRVGSGFKDKDREEIWKRRNFYKGKKAEIKYQNVTDDNTSLRFPVFKKWKLDR